MHERLLRLSEAANILGISVDTLRAWDRKNKIKTIRTPGGHRRIPMSEVLRLLNIREGKLRCAIYARVSSGTRKTDLKNQIEVLKKYAKENNWEIVAEVSDIASGLKEKRRGLRRLINLAKRKQIDVILITYKDRLARFGYNYLVELFNAFGVSIVTVFTKNKADMEELIEDFVAIITSFAGKIYGKRSRQLKKLINQI